MNNFKKRAFTGIILFTVITFAVSWNSYSFLVLIFIINLLSLTEFYNLFKTEDIFPRKSAGFVLSLSLIITFYVVLLGFINWKLLLLNIPIIFLIFISELYLKAVKPFYNLAFTFLGLIVVTIPILFFIAIPFLSASRVYQFQIILGYLFMLWANDTFAYLFGKTLGKHALFKRISPGKTWEGSLGGLIGCLFVSQIVSFYFSILQINQWMIISFIIVITGTYGDFIKSLLKRSLNLKDSGNLLPGHGGMLDRFDSLLGSAPFVFLYLILFNEA